MSLSEFMGECHNLGKSVVDPKRCKAAANVFYHGTVVSTEVIVRPDLPLAYLGQHSRGEEEFCMNVTAGILGLFKEGKLT